jgi:threonine synthase
LIDGDERVMLFNTGAGLKYPDLVRADIPVMAPGDDL